MSTAPSTESGVGAQVRERRHQQGLTLVALAERSGLSQPFLSQVENGRAAPSVESLYRIASALGTTPQALFDGGRADDGELVLARAADTTVAQLATPGESLRRLLLPGDAPFHVIELVGLATEFRERWQHPGTEALYVVAGPIEVEVGGEVHLLRTGDFVSYPAHLPHRYRSALGPAAKALLIETQLHATQRGAHSAAADA